MSYARIRGTEEYAKPLSRRRDWWTCAARIPKSEAPDRAGKASKIRGLQESGRLDLNQRPLAPQAVKRPSQGLRSLRKRLQLLDNAHRQASSHHNESQAFLEILLPICCQICRAAPSYSACTRSRS